MKKIFVLYFCTFNFLFASAQIEQKHILVLHSYNKSMSWVQNIDKAINDTLQPDNNNYVMYTEYMDTKRFFSKEYLKNLKNSYQLKYKNIKFDLILSSDNNAYDFLRKNRDELFGDVPVSFCGVNFFKSSDLNGLTNFTGAEEIFDAKSTIETALKLYPKAKDIFIINDYLTTGKAWKKTIKEQLKGIDRNIRYSQNSTIEELQGTLTKLDKNTIVLLGVYFKDKEGKYFTYEKIGELIATSSNVPVFCLLEFNLGKGVVGGNVIGGYYQGIAQSKIAQKILNGTSVKDLPVQTKGSTKYVFDYNGLVKYNMDLSSIPKDAKILNKPVSFYQMHKTVIIISLIVISVLTTVIILLLINIKKRKETENLLKKSQAEIININENLEEKIKEKTKEQTLLLSLFDKGDSVLFKWNNDEHWSVAYVSQSVGRLLGYTPKEFLDGDIVYANCIDKTDLKTVIEEVETGSNSAKNYFKHKPYRLVTKDGNVKWVLDYTIIIRDDEGNITHYIGYIADITQEKEAEKLIAEQSKLVAMGEMIGNIAHQWRQPLSVISTAATGMVMQKEHNLLTDEKFIKTCDSINDNAQYLSKTIDDFRDFIKGERKIVEFQLYDNIESFLHLVEGSIKNNDLKIIKDIEDKLLRGYPNELNQCFINIFNNSKDALKAKKGDRLIFISTKIEDDKINIVFKDNAGGIPEDILPKIFEPYFTTKHQSQGTGLGLSMTYNLITNGMNGTITANNITYQYDDKNYAGIEFVITLPFS
jgi:PAS domain S-box-containing protein